MSLYIIYYLIVILNQQYCKKCICGVLLKIINFLLEIPRKVYKYCLTNSYLHIYFYYKCVFLVYLNPIALISNNFASLLGSGILCATIYLALAGV